MTDISSAFSDTYAEAREKFIAAANEAQATITSYEQAEKGPNGERLFIDFATVGPDDAENAIIIVSGTHGVEAFCGAGIQVNILSNPDELAKYADTKIVFLHGHNPYGWAWLRRGNQDNIDLNRNYVDFSRRFGSNEAYSEVHKLMLPDDFDVSATNAIDSWVEEHGQAHFFTVALTGQRIDPNGIFYGGLEHAWATKTVSKALPTFVKNQKRVCLIDVHTGMGGYAGALILHAYEPGSTNSDRFNDWYEDKVTNEMEGVDTSEIEYDNSGAIATALDDLLPDHETLGVVIEYGVVDLRRTIDSLVADNWLHAKGDLGSDQAKAIKQENLDCLYGNTDDWKRKVWEHSSWMIESTAKGLRALCTKE